MDYQIFLTTKAFRAPDSGLHIDPSELHPSLFGFQRELTAWALRKGRAAILAATGLGKTRMQIEWARHLGQPTLILAPLAVAAQTVDEARHLGVTVTHIRDDGDAETLLSAYPDAIGITNYERLPKINPGRFGAVVLDESSILKAFSGTVKRELVAAFRDTPYRLCATATPAPNDLEELCNQADFLGVMSPAEMRSTFFIADSRGEFMRYRLKGHARDAFFRWMASWAAAARRPSDLGYPDDGYDLPPYTLQPHFVGTDWTPDGQLFTPRLEGVTQRAQVRRDTLRERVDCALDVIRAEPDERWLVWTGLNDESHAVADGLRAALSGATMAEVSGPDDADDKAAALLAFARGNTQILVSKPSLAGHGMNFQSCARMIFVGLGDSFELYHQAIRRCWRFGQTRQVQVHIVLSEPERTIYRNVTDKERQHERMTGGLIAGAVDAQHHEIFAGTSKGDTYDPVAPLTVPSWMETEAA